MVNGKTRVFALLGSPVEHSVSPRMQNAAFRALGLNAAYVPLSCDSAAVPALLVAFAGAGGGGNVTVPHKERAAESVTFPSPTVREVGACNTFWGQGNGVGGENTDVAGILAALDKLEAPSSCWFVLGTGGSARAVCAAALKRGAAVAIQSRSQRRKEDFEQWAGGFGLRVCRAEECEVAINATPLGLKAADPLPMPPSDLPLLVAALDLVYARQRTRWVHALRKRGVRAEDGREAVVAQGAAAFECWYPEERAPTEVMRAVVNATLR
ncbi:MAG: shikimate dehydrogenase [Gemmatimonadota bacterium]